MRRLLNGLAWCVWWLVTRSAFYACIALAWHYVVNKDSWLPGIAWVGLASVVVVLIVLVEED